MSAEPFVMGRASIFAGVLDDIVAPIIASTDPTRICSGQPGRIAPFNSWRDQHWYCVFPAENCRGESLDCNFPQPEGERKRRTPQKVAPVSAFHFKAKIRINAVECSQHLMEQRRDFDPYIR
jgi:hypothetical protein